jgi:hypothetical protein
LGLRAVLYGALPIIGLTRVAVSYFFVIYISFDPVDPDRHALVRTGLRARKDIAMSWSRIIWASLPFIRKMRRRGSRAKVDVAVRNVVEPLERRMMLYTMYSGTVQTKLQTVTMPGIGTGQNGPGTGSPDSSSTFYDIYGRSEWTKDGDGHINYTAYDQATGAVVKTITDVVYASLSGDEQTSFGLTGWSNPSGGLHLVTTYVVDALGRTTKTTDPAGKISYAYNNDTGFESRSYPGWQSVSGTATSSGSTTTIICTSLTGADKVYIGQSVLVTGGTDNGQQSVVTGWNASTHTLTFSPAFSSATTTSTAFIIAGTTGPIQISRQYRAAANSTYWSYSESLSIAAAPHLASDGTPDAPRASPAAISPRSRARS